MLRFCRKHAWDMHLRHKTALSVAPSRIDAGRRALPPGPRRTNPSAYHRHAAAQIVRSAPRPSPHFWRVRRQPLRRKPPAPNRTATRKTTFFAAVREPCHKVWLAPAENAWKGFSAPRMHSVHHADGAAEDAASRLNTPKPAPSEETGAANGEGATPTRRHRRPDCCDTKGSPRRSGAGLAQAHRRKRSST